MDSKRMAMEVFSLMLALTGVLVLISCAAVRDRAAEVERGKDQPGEHRQGENEDLAQAYPLLFVPETARQPV